MLRYIAGKLDGKSQLYPKEIDGRARVVCRPSRCYKETHWCLGYGDGLE